MKHLVNHLLTSHLGRIALLTMPLLLAVAAPASAAKYNGTGYYNYFPDPPPSSTCLLAGGGADLVTFVGQTVNAVSVVHNPGPNATIEVHVIPTDVVGVGASGCHYHVVGGNKEAFNNSRHQDSSTTALRTTSSRRLAVHPPRSC